jgi:SAM-dependent methyltransferase
MNELVSKDYVFRWNGDKLDFVGDFDGLYKNDQDPWGQSGSDERLKEYYKYSRNKLVEMIQPLLDAWETNYILDVGCGFGYSTNNLRTNLSGDVSVTGVDICKTAVEKAVKLFPELCFLVDDICSPDFSLKAKYDIIIMDELLWYLLENLSTVFQNINKALKDNGYLIFVNGFPRDQRYGKEIMDGFSGLIGYVLSNRDEYELIKAERDNGQFVNVSGIAVFRKTKYDLLL